MAEDVSNFAADIEAAAGEEPILAVVVGSRESWREREREVPLKTGVVLTWEEVRPALDYTYDTGYGGADCDPIWAWTATRIIAVHEYDGATSVGSLPRNPQDGEPGYL